MKTRIGQLDFLFPALDLILRKDISQVDANTNSLVCACCFDTFLSCIGDKGHFPCFLELGGRIDSSQFNNEQTKLKVRAMVIITL